MQLCEYTSSGVKACSVLEYIKYILLIISMLLIFRYMVDAADREKVEASRNELHNLLDKPQLQGIPVSVLLKPFFLYFCDFCTSHANLCVVFSQ